MEGGMRTLWADGVDKVMSGMTSLEELARVTTI
jgi:type II secretory ATPase GspE/PulE/Tfp pilus assembly ATPase PilB-like protein